MRFDLPIVGDGPGETPAFLEEQIITYLGNKRTLLPLIGAAVARVQRAVGRERLSVLDLFAGTGIVARYLKRFSHTLLVNDLETYSRITNQCYLTNASCVDQATLAETLVHLETEIARHWAEGFICDLYAPKDEVRIAAGDRVFYTRRNAAYLDTARQAIGRLPTGIQTYFLAPLLAAASVHANTAGVFKGFYKNSSGVGQYGGHGRNALNRILGEIRLTLPIFSRFECDWAVYQRDANALVLELPPVDLAYFDPPYNQHPYGSNYFMLNLLAEYRRPVAISPVSGIPKDWKRSQYNRRPAAAQALFEAVAACPASFILISYNSEGFIPQREFLDRLSAFGQVEVCATPYQTFRGSRNLQSRPIQVTEFLYLLRKNVR